MEMPNTIPNALNTRITGRKICILPAKTSLANYSFYMGISNDNADEVLKMNKRKKEFVA